MVSLVADLVAAMEELRGILENAISKIETISSPPTTGTENNQQPTSSNSNAISRAEANWRWAVFIFN